MNLGLRNQVALVTGASSGIGRAVAAGLAAEEVRLALCARDPRKLEATVAQIRARTDAEILTLAVDLREPQSATQVVEAARQRFGQIDILVNNAAGAVPMGDFLAIPDEQWATMWNEKGLWYVRMARAALPVMKERGGRIVNIAAASARDPTPITIAQGMTNAALVNFTKALAELAAPWNILVTAISPGPTRTERFESALARQAKATGQTPAEALATIAGSLPLGRVAEPEEIADLVCFLASRRAAFLSGICITIDGGAARGVYP